MKAPPWGAVAADLGPDAAACPWLRSAAGHRRGHGERKAISRQTRASCPAGPGCACGQAMAATSDLRVALGNAHPHALSTITACADTPARVGFG